MEESKVYIPDDENAWLPATVLKVDENGKLFDVVLDATDKNGEKIHRQIDLRDENMPETLPLQNSNYDKGLDSHVEDMCLLGNLHEPAILYNLKERFHQGLPYTYTGNIVLAVNPYQWHDIYTQTHREMYLSKERKSLPPHVYYASATAYKTMIDQGNPQSILVSGESGAGKTETVKIMMEHLATVSGSSPLGDCNIIKKVLKSNPLLESFGNAKTIKNDNSSRFGKFTQLQFDKQNYLVGAKCRHYLLEKSRVIQQANGERNYHIFYQLLYGHEHVNLKHKTISDFPYLKSDANNNNNNNNMEEDKKNYEATCDALKTIDVSQEEQDYLFNALIGILYLGKIEFQTKEKEDACMISSLSSSSSSLHITCDLLGTFEEEMNQSLCNRTIRARNEIYNVPLTMDQAIMNRDALSKEIYARIFSWLIHDINEKISQDRFMMNHIDLLDIFGFECFEKNNFEQFCINYCNEKLQQRFTQDVFKSVQEEYKQQNISWNYISYVDNADMLELIEGKMGLIDLLNEECIRPKGNDLSFASKVITSHEQHYIHRLERHRLNEKYCFTLHHYAGSVVYHANNFVEKNRDALQLDVFNCLSQSKNPFIQKIFNINHYHHPNNYHHDLKGGSLNMMNNETVSSKFKTQLNVLMNDISLTDVNYIRCIKPNQHKTQKEFHCKSVVHQLRCAGVIEAIRITRAAFPNKMTHELFLQRFVPLKTFEKKTSLSFVSSLSTTASQACQELANLLILSSSSSSSSSLSHPVEKKKNLEDVGGYVMGKTKIYFRNGVLEQLEDRRTIVIHQQIIKIQNQTRRWCCFKQYKKLRNGMILFQALRRKYLIHKKFQNTKKKIIFIQSLIRGKSCRQQKHHLKENQMLIQLQSFIKSWLYFHRYQKKRNQIILIQSMMKKKIQMKKFYILKEDNKKQMEMENQLNDLKKRLHEEQCFRQQVQDENNQLTLLLQSNNNNNNNNNSNNQQQQQQKQKQQEDEEEKKKGMRESSSNITLRNSEDIHLIDDSKKMLTLLTGQVNKLREQNQLYQNEIETLKMENKQIKDAYSAAGASFAALNQHNKQQSKANLRLMSTHAALIKSQEEKMKKYQKQITGLKEDLRMQKNVYSEELIARVTLQDLIMNLIHLMESHQVDPNLILQIRNMTSETNQHHQQNLSNIQSEMNQLNENEINENEEEEKEDKEDLLKSSLKSKNISSRSFKKKNSSSPKNTMRHTVMMLKPKENNLNSIKDQDTRESWAPGSDKNSRSSTILYEEEEEGKPRKSIIGGMFKKMFKKDDSK